MVAILALGLSACASAVYRVPGMRVPATQRVEISSDPAGATVRLDGVIVGLTPTTVRIPRRAAQPRLVLELTGYARSETVLKRIVSGATYGNLAFAPMALNPMNGPNGMSDARMSRAAQVVLAILLPVAGIGLDLSTGAAYAVQPRVHVPLKRLPELSR